LIEIDLKGISNPKFLKSHDFLIIETEIFTKVVRSHARYFGALP
jgi:hypothetical protein